MTQITDDLRSSEPQDALPPSLREKILADVPLAPNNGGTVSNTSGSPIIGGGGASRIRRLPAWAFAAVALVAWFIFYPLYQKTRQQATATRNLAMTSPTAPVAAHPPVRVAQAQSATVAGTPNNPVTSDKPALPADVPEPMRAKTPPPPLDVEYAPAPQPEAVPGPRAVHASPAPALPASVAPRAYTTNGAPPVSSINGNGSGTSNLLNGDPDSLRQVHKEASIGLRVPDPDATGDKINAMVKETGGYVAANNLTTDTDGLKSGELIVKVPEAQFDVFLAAVAGLGTVVSKNVTGQDITEKTSDAHEAQSVEESDLTQAEARLKKLGSHAKWEDTQNAEDLRVQLAQTRARLKLLKRMAALGTLTIDLSQTPKSAAAVPVTGGFLGTLQTTTHDALQSLVGSAAALLALVIWLLAYAPIWVPLLLVGRYALKEYRKREVVSSKG